MVGDAHPAWLAKKNAGIRRFTEPRRFCCRQWVGGIYGPQRFPGAVVLGFLASPQPTALRGYGHDGVQILVTAAVAEAGTPVTVHAHAISSPGLAPGVPVNVT